MKVTKRKAITLLLGLIVIISLSIIGLLNISATNSIASADTTDEMYNDFIVTEYSENIKATYNFVKLNDNECSVRIANKSEATKAIIPSFAIIDGKTYTVTEVAANGFMSSSKLVKVSLPSTIKKIGNMAFANCPELQRVSLANVEEIGSSVFYRCPKLGKLVIPESTEKIGTYILRDNSTEVKVRAKSDGANWANSWNLNNSNQEVEYNSKYVEPLELEPIYNTNTRAADSTIIGYVVSSRQPRTDNYYAFSPDVEDGSIYIPAEFNGLDILAIESYAFENTFSEEIVIGYSNKPIMLSDGAFASSSCDVILINRPIEYLDYETNSETSNIFTFSMVQTIVLPDSLNSIADSMFNSCENLKNIYFRSDRNVLNIINEQDEIEEGIVHLPDTPNFDTIGQNAFEGTINITELHIYGNVKNVGEYIVDGWVDEEQTVYIHDYKSIPEYDYNTKTGWHPDWKGSFTNSKFYEEFYKIKFNANGGTVSTEEKEVVFNREIGQLPIPTYPKDVIFAGWYDSDSGEFYTESTVYTNKSDITLTAKWQCQIEYKLKSYYTVKKIYDLNETVSLYDYYRAGFTGKYLNSADGKKYDFNEKYTVTENTSFTAIWTEKPIAECYGYATSPYAGYWYSIYGPEQLKSLKKLSNVARVRLMEDIDTTTEDWEPFEQIGFELNGQGHTITYKNEHVNGDSSFGFTKLLLGQGYITNVNFRARIKTTFGTATGNYIGIIAAQVQGYSISDCNVFSWVGKDNSYYNSISDNNVDILVQNSNTITGAFAGLSYGSTNRCENTGVSIASFGSIGGIIGENHSSITYCINRGNIYYDLNENNSEMRYIGGIAGFHEDNFRIQFCKNYATIKFVKVTKGSTINSPAIGQIVGIEESAYGTSSLYDNECNGNVISNLNSLYNSYVSNSSTGYYKSKKGS